MVRTFENMATVGKAMRVAAMQILYAIVFGILSGTDSFFFACHQFCFEASGVSS